MYICFFLSFSCIFIRRQALFDSFINAPSCRVDARTPRKRRHETSMGRKLSPCSACPLCAAPRLSRNIPAFQAEPRHTSTRTPPPRGTAAQQHKKCYFYVQHLNISRRAREGLAANVCAPTHTAPDTPRQQLPTRDAVWSRGQGATNAHAWSTRSARHRVPHSAPNRTERFFRSQDNRQQA